MPAVHTGAASFAMLRQKALTPYDGVAKEHEDDKQPEYPVDQDAIGAIGFFFDGLGYPRLSPTPEPPGQAQPKEMQ